MNDTLMLLLSVCAVLLVVGGLVIVGGYLIIRFVAGGRVFEALGLGGLSEMLGGERGEQVASSSPPARRRPTLNAPDLDFDAAVARHAADDASPRRVDPKQPDFPQTSSSDFDPPPARSRRRRRRDSNEDELFGGLLDEDGDGDVDF